MTSLPPEMKPVLLLLFLCLVLGEMFVLMVLSFGSGVVLAQRAPQIVEQYVVNPFFAAVECITTNMRRVSVTINEESKLAHPAMAPTAPSKPHHTE